MSDLSFRFAWLYCSTVLFAATAMPIALLLTGIGVTVPMAAWVCASFLSISAILASAGNAIALEHAIRYIQWFGATKPEQKRVDAD